MAPMHLGHPAHSETVNPVRLAVPQAAIALKEMAVEIRATVPEITKGTTQATAATAIAHDRLVLVSAVGLLATSELSRTAPSNA